MLQNIERLTKIKIAFEKVPSVEALRARQMELTTETLREALAGETQERFESVLTDLLQEFNIEQIALAAIKLTHDAEQSSLDEVDIPDLSNGDPRDRRDRGDRRDGRDGRDGRRGDSRGDSRERFDRSGSNDRSSRFGRDERPDRGGRFERGPARGRGSGPTAKLYVGLGRKAGIRPQDLVGAIANESGISGRDIGDIKVSDQFSIVEVPGNEMDNILNTMKNVSIRGKKANVRLYRDER
jgi:ATP-dependent RNA helicase DeaD